MGSRIFSPLVVAALVFSWLAVGPMPRAVAAPVSTAPAAAVCASSVGPGIPHPANLPAGVPGFHAQWYGQSGYPTLCPGARSTATVAYYNSGSRGWGARADGGGRIPRHVGTRTRPGRGDAARW